MSASFVQLGQAVDFVPSRDIAAGEILVCNGMAGAVKIPVRAGELGALHLSGVYDVEKDGSAVGAGDRVYFDPASRLATGIAEGGVFLGVAAANSPAESPKVRVILNFGHPGATGAGSTEGIQWQTMNQ